ncbi:pyruvate, phosphate dikinase [SCandidatus Aminicenantes bacterium Aminicenantia_JdfR_composite]|jgi:pyruvate,orthophosphate dikinase|nr:pyruvate, phosphate dikinase [SCandidatus Aminicenantes bacterium Aminicenantia_JdfR_composite]MCP2596594.1 pyruvate, phosphate dikinase [Candidatus Aminicenantes bacterium AC-335-G13]MCP2598193.1 pyruvate, phosphate dikinase [Candidatus Aminicenantes bacterium AC-335-L06]
MKKKYVYFFGPGGAEGNKDMKDILGGKGSGLAEMTNAGLPVPPGFTISTEVCNIFYQNDEKVPEEVMKEILENLKKLEEVNNKKFGDRENPLLLSVRSGAKFSMPGMMDTILNLGLNDETVEGLAKKTGNRRFALDCYRRFIHMFGDVVLGIPKQKFEEILSKIRKEAGVKYDYELDEKHLEKLISEYKKLVKKESGKDFPQDVFVQLKMAIEAVFKSWNNPRAIVYRKLNNIPHNLGTAVNIQTMVFGNYGPTSGTGVGFTRNPATGEKEFYGEFLLNAQGEDVVAGVRTPMPLTKLKEVLPEVYDQLKEITDRLERHYRDVQDFEFTIQEGKLYMLQTRSGKRTGIAAVKIAVDMVEEGIITEEEALELVEPQALDQLLHPVFDPKEKEKYPAVAKGLAASPGAATGQVVFTAEDAVKWVNDKKRVILVRSETSPDDIHGMSVSQGILTAVGGMTSHAAIVGRQMGKPSVVGCGALRINEEQKYFEVNGKMVKEGDWISIDGTTGEVILAHVPTKPSEIIQVIEGTIPPEKSQLYQYFTKLLSWADKVRRLRVRANADTPRDARIAYSLGAEGIGLCRTEHMFFAEDRLPYMKEMILSTSEEERRKALEKLLPLQREDFYQLFKEMKGYPVTIRTLDPPLHEFLPSKEDLRVEITTLKLQDPEKNKKKIEELEKLLHRVEALFEFNPMLGHRGCRLGITYPEITELQARAIFEAACRLAKEGGKVIPEIMIPLVGHVNELAHQKEIVERVGEEVMKKYGVKVDYTVGTMIEIPRAAITADKVAEEAQFFSFGTNDLTQTVFGISRDDAGKFLVAYLEKGIWEKDPFETIDQDGVGEVMKIAVEKGRKTRPDLKIGICGEHGGEPLSVEFCHKIGLDYVSCSPFRIPIARLAAAQAALKEKKK